MRTSRKLIVGGASAVVLAGGFVAAPAPLSDDVDEVAAAPEVDDDCEIKDIDPDSNSGRGNTEDPIEERERDDDCDEPSDAGGSTGAGAPADEPATEAGATTETVDGPVVTNIRGEYQVRLIIDSGVVVDVEFPVAGTEASESRRVNEMALPVLEERILAAQSGDVEYVSGASYTSPAMVESAQAAFADAGL
ncbi:FMN-binding protein [Demequina activiva]|uniref:FMN-binding domain-containing protein n=1 Tax=Demequina activiva TaxID=1582364 RepID=A0A919PZL2_9MICO|nr:FMN-binding protein [Demequina activiva]GIG53266.1 hypothetical protein Dac01nite_00180 [Demequina activiva]